MRADEREFLKLLVMEQFQAVSSRRSIRQLIDGMTALRRIEWRRALNLLQKYACRGWYAYGLVPWDGAFTESGVTEALKALRAEEKHLWPAE